MEWMRKKKVVEEVAIIVGLIGVQIVYAGNAVLQSYLMSLDINPKTLVIFFTFASFLVVSPIAVFFERSKWPKNFSLKLLIQLFMISFGGVFLFQWLFLKGIHLTSPALGTAMPNLAPGLIFLIAWTFGLEKVKMSCMYSKVKVLGTVLCVAGTLTMSIVHSKTKVDVPDVIFDMDKIIGCFYLLVAVFILSSTVVLQAATLGDFPAPMSLCAITSLIGVVITAVVQLFEDDMGTGWRLVSLTDLIAYSLLGGSLAGGSVSFGGWAMKKKGPVLVSMFSPVGTVCSVILSAVTLGDTIQIGSLAGMLVMFTGVYFVLWAKAKEGHSDGQGFESEFHAQNHEGGCSGYNSGFLYHPLLAEFRD